MVLLVAIVAVSGMALGYAAGYPLRFVDYEPSSAVALDQASLAGNVEVTDALVVADDLGPGWVAGDPAIAGFGVLGADVCGEAVETPTPLSELESAVWRNETNDAIVISQALRVDRWRSAEEYVGDVANALEECDSFFSVVDGDRTEVLSTELDRDPPVTDHVDRRYQSPNGLQEWSIMAVGDVIVAIDYIGSTPPRESFLGEVERSVLARTAPDDFAPPGIGTEADGIVPESTTTAAPEEPAGDGP